MKKIVLILCVLTAGLGAEAQKKAPAKAAAANKTKPAAATPAAAPGVNLVHNGAYAARSGPQRDSFFIADPAIRAFNQRSNGANIRLSGSGVLGAPRGTFGFANGQISLRTTDAPSIGGITGSGSVGTGTSAGGVGMGGMVPMVNGKNVYAGPAIWGSARNLQLSDSVLRRRPGQ